MRTDKYIFVETFTDAEGYAFPKPLEEGKVYFCKEYSHSVHLCPCGCKDEVHIPFKEKNEKEAFWGLSGNSFTPSIFKRDGCKSHYFITNGIVQWH